MGGFDILERLGRGIPRLEQLLAPENVWGRLNQEGTFLDTAGDIAREITGFSRTNRGQAGDQQAAPYQYQGQGDDIFRQSPIQSGSLVDMVNAGAAGGSWQNVQNNIAQARFNNLKAGLDQLRRQGGGGGGGGNAGIINARIARAKEELAEGNQGFDNFFEDIAPGFEEALTSARAVAEAEAAIEGHFTGTQEAIDERYATAEGGVQAIADSLGNSSPSLSEAISTSIYEFKEFIDQDLHLEKESAIALNAAASSLAVAAAEAGHAEARGAGARDQFQFQKKYEKIIQNLLDQRSAASGARGNSLRGAAEQLLANYNQSQPYTRDQMGAFVMFDMVNQVVPPAQQDIAYRSIQTMQSLGIRTWRQFERAGQEEVKDELGQGTGQWRWVDNNSREIWNTLAPYANVIESAVSRATQGRIDELYNQMFQDPQTSFDQFNVNREEGFNAGLDFGGATDYANQQLLQNGQVLSDLGSILDQLERDGYGDLFGLGG